MPALQRLEAVDLPLATRDALVRLLLAELASQAASGAIDEMLRALEAPASRADDGMSDVHSVLASAGLATADPASPARPPGLGARGVAAPDVASLRRAAHLRLRRYHAALADVPRGTDLDTRLVQARRLLAHALFFEVHEVLEPPWRAATGDERLFLQGIIQAAVAWHHGARGRSAPAFRSATAAATKLAAAPPLWRGFPIGALRARLDADRAALARGEPVTSSRVEI